jgi:hypothetical protein
VRELTSVCCLCMHAERVRQSLTVVRSYSLSYLRRLSNYLSWYGPWGYGNHDASWAKRPKTHATALKTQLRHICKHVCISFDSRELRSNKHLAVTRTVTQMTRLFFFTAALVALGVTVWRLADTPGRRRLDERGARGKGGSNIVFIRTAGTAQPTVTAQETTS